MDFQPRAGSQDGFGLFADGRASQPYVEGTVARGEDELRADPHFYQGIVDGDWAATFPERIALDMTTMKRGQDRFAIYCAPCHGRSGDGQYRQQQGRGE